MLGGRNPIFPVIGGRESCRLFSRHVPMIISAPHLRGAHSHNILLSRPTKWPVPSIVSTCCFCKKWLCDTTYLPARSLIGVSRCKGLKEDGVGECFSRDTLALFDNGFAELSDSSFVTFEWNLDSTWGADKKSASVSEGWKVSSVSSSLSSLSFTFCASPDLLLESLTLGSTTVWCIPPSALGGA